TAIILSVDTRAVPERSDQATIPGLEVIDGKEDVGSGPHNVPRALLEMSVDSPEMSFYLGSFAEVIATLRGLAGKSEGEEGVIWQGLSGVNDARQLIDLSQSLGLPVSERNAYRVLGGEIAPLVTVYRMAEKKQAVAGEAEKSRPSSAYGRGTLKRNPLRRIPREDLAEIGSEATRSVESIIGRYYLKAAGTPHVKRGRGKLIISIYVSGEDGDD
ncbi:MAG: hypothetical protein KKH73_03465, partial [Actinobacteria bacterium]|nr:hypothetical protein [Actinomycetota bacterium]